MTGRDFGFLGALLALAVFIWVRDLTWASAAGDALPILAALPLFYWLGKPWKFESSPKQIPTAPIALAAAGLVLGIVTNVTILFALSWTLLLWAWLRSRLDVAALPVVKKLLVLPLLAFPWITLDCQWIGWYFRLSAAWVVTHLFGLMGFGVVQDGTNLTVQGMKISVEAACSGMNTLQSMLIAGTTLAFIFLGKQRHFWWNIPVLFALSWVANTVRIITLVVAALTVSPEFSQGMFHTWGSWLVLVLMFLLCWGLFALQRQRPAMSAAAA